MNILMLSDAYFPRVNGVSTSIQSFARALVRLGHKVTLIAPSYPSGERYLPFDDDSEPFTILRIPSLALPIYRDDRLMNYFQLTKRIASLKPQNFDILHIHTPFVAHYAGLKIARRLGIPTVETYHTFFEAYLQFYLPILPGSWTRCFARAISRRQCNQVDRVVTPSRVIGDALSAYGVDTPLEILPTGLDLRDFAQGDGSEFRRKHGIPPTAPLLVHVSRVAYEKNIAFILRMFQTLLQREPRARLAICGEGPARRAMEELARQLGIADRVHFLGFLNRKIELMQAYRAADVFVFASRTETQGLVLLEALALGVPVVSTAVLGTREVLREGAGTLIAPEDESAFADRVMELLSDPQRRHHLALAARDYVRSWTAASKAGELSAIYRRVVEEFGVVRAGYGDPIEAAPYNRS